MGFGRLARGQRVYGWFPEICDSHASMWTTISENEKARTVAKLNHATLHASWRHLIKRFPMNAGTVRSLECYLTATGKIVADDRKTVTLSVAEKLSEEYVTYLREVRGFAIHSMANHRRVSPVLRSRRPAASVIEDPSSEGHRGFRHPSR